MKFDDMKMEKLKENMAGEKAEDRITEMIIKDIALGREAVGMFAELSIYGQNSLLTTCFDLATEARGITPSEYLDELKHLYKEAKETYGRQTEDP